MRGIRRAPPETLPPPARPNPVIPLAIPLPSWLDGDLKDWNRPGVVPRPALVRASSRSREERRPSTAAERAVVRGTWRLYGRAERSGPTRVFTAAAGFDGAGRPVAYQAFVERGGRLVGTLSPTDMAAGGDGALQRVRVETPARIVAVFGRLREVGGHTIVPGLSTVRYAVEGGARPRLRVLGVAGEKAAAVADPLAGSWILAQPDAGAHRPTIAFDPRTRTVSGSGGVNRFGGRYAAGPDDALRLSEIVSTKMAGRDEAANRAEARFFRILGSVDRYHVEGNTLTLTQDAGDVGFLLVFERG